jgi:hypothetical protein
VSIIVIHDVCYPCLQPHLCLLPAVPSTRGGPQHTHIHTHTHTNTNTNIHTHIHKHTHTHTHTHTYTHTHTQVGHNIGAHHDRSSVGSNNFNSYNFGYCWDTSSSTCSRSVLAYSGCTTTNGQVLNPLSLYFFIY